jgi:xylulokinase
MSGQDLFLAIDVGTGSVRSALVDRRGGILAFAAREHDQIVPQFGWAEQRPADWWTGAAATIREVVDRVEGGAARIACIAACGQMHGTVLVDDGGRPTRETAPLWNDKRTRSLVDAFAREHDVAALMPATANPPTVAWPGFKLAWLRDHDPEAYRRAATMLMPKDWIGFRLTGERAIDRPEATTTFLLDARTGEWSPALAGLLGIDIGKLPALAAPTDMLGAVTAAAAAETGLREGTPVAVGAGDFPATLLGSGAHRPGLGSDITGTSTLVTIVLDRPVIDPVITNVMAIDRGWSAFTIIDAGGDAMRWARRAFHEKAWDYERIVAAAGEAPAGADRLLFLPYLNGERLGPATNARAQFFGLTASHGAGHLHRAVMEGVAFAARRNIALMQRAGAAPERIVAAGGGAKTALWLEIKASIWNVPLVTVAEAEAGVLGCAAMAGVASGAFAGIGEAVDRLVRIESEIAPNPAWAERYARMAELFDTLYAQAIPLYTRLESLP